MIAIGADHGGFLLKEKIIERLSNEYGFKDFGTNSEERVDYPEIAFKVAESVSNGECESGILICKSGVGMSIAANKVKNIRCANINTVKNATLCKEHNNANIIALGADDLSLESAIEIIYAWLKADFLADRHQKRIDLIKEYENK